MTNNRIDSASRVINASSESLYQAFLNPKTLIEWLPPEGMSGEIEQFEPREGGAYKMILTYETDYSAGGKTSENTDISQGNFLVLAPNKKIVQSIIFDTEDSAFKSEMIQTWYFETVPEGTKVTVLCENVPQGIRKEDHDVGLRSTLENLATLTE